MGARPTVPRGRHAPPLEVRLSLQRDRLLDAAACVFSRSGYPEATAEAIAREAGMSKATFYEHFANKEDCIIAIFDESLRAILEGIGGGEGDAAATAGDRREVSNRIRAFLEIVEANPDRAQTLLVEMVGAGPRAVERRDEAMSAAAGVLFTAAQRAGFGYETELDAFAAVGATVELVSRQLRRGKPARLAELQPVLERLFFGLRRTG